MKQTDYTIRILTPCFNGSADAKNRAELRVPSMRGQIRWWFRAASPLNTQATYEREKKCFGGVFGDAGVRSAAAFRLTETQYSQKTESLLPHKVGFPQPALPPGSFTLSLSCKDGEFEDVDRAVRLWILLGGLGCRSNRAAGSLWLTDDAPLSAKALASTLRALDCPDKWDIHIASVENTSAARTMASNTVKGSDVYKLFGGVATRENDFQRSEGVSRRASPIKFKVIELSGQPNLLMFAPDKGMWGQALEALQNRCNNSPKPLTQLDWISVL